MGKKEPTNNVEIISVGIRKCFGFLSEMKVGGIEAIKAR